MQESGSRKQPTILWIHLNKPGLCLKGRDTVDQIFIASLQARRTLTLEGLVALVGILTYGVYECAMTKLSDTNLHRIG